MTSACDRNAVRSHRWWQRILAATSFAVLMWSMADCGDSALSLTASGLADEQPTKTGKAKRTPLTSSKAATKTSGWLRFRGPSGMGTSDAKGLPLNWGESENLAWKTELPGPGASSPIVFQDRIYLTCYTGFFIPGGIGWQSGRSQAASDCRAA